MASEGEMRNRDAVVAYYCYCWKRAHGANVVGTSTTLLLDGAVLLEMEAHAWGGSPTFKSALIVMPGGSPVVPVTVESPDG